MLDAEHGEAAAVDQLGVMAVVALVLEEDVPERVPVRRALHAQHDGVVGVADLVPVLLAGDRVGAGRQHLVDRIEAAAEQAGLRPRAIERNAERERLALLDELGRGDDVLGLQQVQRADLVFLAPAAPVRQLLRRFLDGLEADFDLHAFPRDATLPPCGGGGPMGRRLVLKGLAAAPPAVKSFAAMPRAGCRPSLVKAGPLGGRFPQTPSILRPEIGFHLVFNWWVPRACPWSGLQGMTSLAGAPAP